ncbi:uncharacterized protein BT62DRAFT_1034725 [Guyanagaster necrorhizus]|uniref:Uncharacterized protein n=1 Tax=Guyanagaster necrorhizus TaxID=856835 RepID=A0A9P7VNR9_9AGAR|nr:uncharacterized protein BT62DRAFT_1034725 [Guyanagaster necrorhizus MCA 3950]KAG7443276.1 hypothetical protein BT62DRAFT_1034725 [Guyanagaster necrorhizus MCA 3950]
MSPVLNPFETAVKSLKRAVDHEPLETASARLREQYIIEIDEILRPSLDCFFTDIRVAFSELAAGVSEGLNAEIPRVREAYQNLPWWDSVPILDIFTESILGIKPRRRAMSLYHEFLSKDEQIGKKERKRGKIRTKTEPNAASEVPIEGGRHVVFHRQDFLELD